jgi:cytochrome b subunit of formate dehydrogenase
MTDRPDRVRLLLAISALAISFFGGAQALAQDSECAECHGEVAFTSAAHPDLVCADCHTNVTAEHEGADLEPLTDDMSCGECHGSVQRAINRSTHGKGNTACGDCHGAPHEIHEASDLASAVSPVNQIKQCGACHDDPPELVDGYLTSEHGRALLLSGLIDAPSCSDCHGGHRIMEADTDRAATSHANSPEMCGECHQLLLNEWRDHSAHGLAWQADEDGPVCVDCHASHQIGDPTTAASRMASAEKCGSCHGEYLTTFRDSFHGKADELGMSGGAICSDCHTPHSGRAASDPESSVHVDNVLQTCSNCHENVTAAFATFDPHNDPTNPDDIFIVYLIWVFMTGLLISVFVFFGVHDLLWLQRSLVGVLRGEFDEERYGSSGKYIQRFRRKNMRMHVVIITTFILLALTGLPLKFHSAPWAQLLVDLLGGIDSTRFIHRVAAIGTFGYMFVHILDVFVRSVFRKERGMFWGPNSMTPQPKDLFDFVGNIRYFLYMGERPPGDRWTYFEKFDYLAVFWGVMMIGVSGLFLWFPDFFTSFLPGWTLNAAYVIHSDEALLATGFIFFFHFFHTHLRPESFPMDLVIFTGRMSLERFKAERPLEYQRLVENNELEDYLVEGPNPRQRRDAYVFGSIFLIIGILLAIGIVWALLAH